MFKMTIMIFACRGKFVEHLKWEKHPFQISEHQRKEQLHDDGNGEKRVSYENITMLLFSPPAHIFSYVLLINTVFSLFAPSVCASFSLWWTCLLVQQA